MVLIIVRKKAGRGFSNKIIKVSVKKSSKRCSKSLQMLTEISCRGTYLEFLD